MNGGVAPGTSPHITLWSSDNRRFVVSRDVAYMSDTLKDMEVDGTDDVPLMDVDGDTLERVLEYCQFHAQRHSAGQRTLDFDEDYMQRLNDDDELFQLFTAAWYLDIKSLLHLVSNKVARRVVAEWNDGDAVTQAFEIDGAFAAHEHNEIVAKAPHVRTSLEAAFGIVDHYTQKPCTQKVLLEPSTRVAMERLLLHEYSLVVPMAVERIGYLHSTFSKPNVRPRARLASHLSRLPSLAVGLVCGHFTEPSPQLLGIIRGRDNKFDRLLRDLEEEGLMEPYVNHGRAIGNSRLKGPPRMTRHDDDPDSDDDWDDYFSPDFHSGSRCNGESCGDIVDVNGKAHIVAAWTGWNPHSRGGDYTRPLLDGETHEDAKSSLCQMKGCSRCDVARNRCVSNTHDKKVSRRDRWIPFLRSHLLQFTPRHAQPARPRTRPMEHVASASAREREDELVQLRAERDELDRRVQEHRQRHMQVPFEERRDYRDEFMRPLIRQIAVVNDNIAALEFFARFAGGAARRAAVAGRSHADFTNATMTHR